MSGGYRSVQSCHSIADFASEHPEEFKIWRGESNSIICLGVRNEEELKKIWEKWSDITPSVIFWEPDISGWTSICLFGTPNVRRGLRNLQLLK